MKKAQNLKEVQKENENSGPQFMTPKEKNSAESWVMQEIAFPFAPNQTGIDERLNISTGGCPTFASVYVKWRFTDEYITDYLPTSSFSLATCRLTYLPFLPSSPLFPFKYLNLQRPLEKTQATNCFSLIPCLFFPGMTSTWQNKLLNWLRPVSDTFWFTKDN